MEYIKEWVEWYRKQGINLIPLREGEKVPLMKWDEFKRRALGQAKAIISTIVCLIQGKEVYLGKEKRRYDFKEKENM